MASGSLHRKNSLSCTRCHLHKTAQSVCVPPRGSQDPIILFVGEGPGRTEDVRNQSFVGWAGKKLDELMGIAGLDSAHCGWTNIVRCIPWEQLGRKVRAPEEPELDACCAHLEPEIMFKKPIFIVPLGAAAASYFLGKSVRIGQVRGKRYAVEIPTVRFRYMRMMHRMIQQGVKDEKLFQTTPAGRERAILRAVSQYAFKDIPPDKRLQVTVFPSWHPASIKYGNPSAEYDIIADLNFLVDRMSGGNPFGDYKLLATVEEAVAYLRFVRSEYRDGRVPYLSYDIESTSLRSFDPKEYITTIGLTHARGEGYVIPWNHHESPFKNDKLVQTAIRQELNHTLEEIPVVGHNIKFDYEFSAVRGIWIRTIYDDSELMGWTLTNDTTPHDLDYMTTRYTDLNLPKQEMKQAQDAFPKDVRYNTDNYELDLIYRYNGADVDSVMRLVPALEQELTKNGLLEAHRYYTVRAMLPTIDMEMNGVPIDLVFHGQLNEEMITQIQDCYDSLGRLGVSEMMENIINEGNTKKRKEFKLSSSAQVSSLLFDVLEFKPVKFGKVRKAGSMKGKKLPSSDKHVLQELLEQSNEAVGRFNGNTDSGEYQLWKLRLEVVRTIQSFKQVEQLYKMYVKNMPKHLNPDGYVRCNFGIRHTDSGRFNCRDPSLHTIPWHSTIKRMFISRFENGLMLSADHAQMELRVFAMATGDDQLIQTFKDGKDIHRMIASRVLGIEEADVPSDERRRIKTVVFGLLYGRGPRSIAAQEGISVERAKEIISSVFKQFPKVRDFIKRKHAEVRRHGQVRYINGFRRVIPVGSEQDEIARAERIAVNTVIQGPASDLAALGMINMRNTMKKLRLSSKHWEFKHDDLAYDIAPGELMVMCNLIQKEMVHRPKRDLEFIGDVPLKVDFELGANWGQPCEVKIVAHNRLEIEGEEEHIEPLLKRLLSWEDAPELLAHEVEVKKKTAVVRSLMKSSGEMVDYNHVKVLLEFPSFVRREPNYSRPGLIEAA